MGRRIRDALKPELVLKPADENHRVEAERRHFLNPTLVMIGVAAFTLLGSLFVLHGQAIGRIDAARTEVLSAVSISRTEFHGDMAATNARLDRVLESVLTVMATQAATAGRE